MKIGVAISTYNRNEIFKKTYEKIVEFLPPNAKLVVVEDAGLISNQEKTFRFETQAGIAKVKNKCIELLEDCHHIFLFDDDCYPIVENWHLPYINSGFQHLSFTFDKHANGVTTGNIIRKRGAGYNTFTNPCGCMIYLTKKVIESVGGMDEEFGLWSYEHVNYSQRIKNLGLTPYEFMDVSNSLSLFYSHDYHGTCERSVPANVRTTEIKRNKPLYLKNARSKEYIPYKEMTGRVITTYFTGVEDPQRNMVWANEPECLRPLIDSVYEIDPNIKTGVPTTILSNSMGNTSNGWVTTRQVECKTNPYFHRWISILEYLKEVKEDYVFCVDATDVVMLNNPFKENLGNYLWVGDETGTIRNQWLQTYHNTPMLNEFFKKYRNMPLLNAGIVGGRKSVVEAFVKRMVWHIENSEVGKFDMGIFNYVLYTEFASQIKHGRKVSNVFKSYNHKGNHWFAHK